MVTSLINFLPRLMMKSCQSSAGAISIAICVRRLSPARSSSCRSCSTPPHPPTRPASFLSLWPLLFPSLPLHHLSPAHSLFSLVHPLFFISARFLPHNHLQSTPPGSLFVALFLDWVSQTRRRGRHGAEPDVVVESSFVTPLVRFAPL